MLRRAALAPLDSERTISSFTGVPEVGNSSFRERVHLEDEACVRMRLLEGRSCLLSIGRRDRSQVTQPATLDRLLSVETYRNRPTAATPKPLPGWYVG